MIPYLMRTCVIGMLLATSAAASESRWRKLPYPPGRAEGIRSIAMENDTLWAMASNAVVYWDGKQWHKPAGPTLRGGTYASNLVGGNGRDLYCTQQGEEGKGLLYRLRDKTAELVAEYPYPRSTARPNFYVSKSGRVFHLMPDGRIGFWSGDHWGHYQAGKSRPVVFEVDGTVCICYPLDRRMARFVHGGLVGTSRLQLQFPAQTRGIRMVRWGDRYAFAMQRAEPKLQCIDLLSGDAVPFAVNVGDSDVDPVNIKQLAETLGPRTVDASFATRDGSAWFLRRRSGSSGYQLDRVTPDGVVETVSTDDSLDAQDFGVRRTPQRVLETSDHALWFGLNDSIIRYADDAFTQYKSDSGYNLSSCRMIEDREGTVYACNGGLYAYYRIVDPPTHLPPPHLATVSEKTKWRYSIDKTDRMEAGWLDGDKIFLTGSNSPLVAVDVKSGEELYRQKLVVGKRQSLGGIPWRMSRDGEQIDFALGKEVVRVNGSDGQIGDRFDLVRDQRIVPLRVPDGFVVVPKYRGREIVRVDDEGERRWSCPLPGYLMGHAVVQNDLIVVQTRGGSYGGQTTVGIGLQDGKIRWEDQTDAYGRGVVFANGGDMIIETDDWLSPKRTEGWTIARDLEGNRLWHHREPEQSSVTPIADPNSERIFSVLSRGKVVCLSAKNGNVIWEQTLPEGPIGPSGSSYFPVWSPHTFQDGKLLVVDRSLSLNVLDGRSGKLITRIALNEDSARPIGTSELIASPWITDDAIIAAFKDKVIAIPLPSEMKVTSPSGSPMIASCPPDPCRPVACPTVSCRVTSCVRGPVSSSRNRFNVRARLPIFQRLSGSRRSFLGRCRSR